MDTSVPSHCKSCNIISDIDYPDPQVPKQEARVAGFFNLAMTPGDALRSTHKA